MGSGFVFFIRSLAPSLGNPSFFTLAFQILSLGMIFTNTSFKTLYKGNNVIFTFYLLFLAYALVFFFFLNKEPGDRIYTATYITLSILYLLFIHKIDYSITTYLLKGILILTLLTNLSLLYSIITNPNFIIGMRATINFNSSTSTSEYSGNPHIYSRNALNAFIISFIFLFKSANSKIHQIIFYWICYLLSMVILLLTLVKTMILMAPIILFTLLLTKRPTTNISALFKQKRKVYLTLLILVLITYFFNDDKILNILSSYGEMGTRFLSNSLYTIFGGDSTESTIDASTAGRVDNLSFVKELFLNRPFYFIFGNGYKFFYVDVPIVEVFLNFGIIGLGLFLIYLASTYFFAIKNLVKSIDPFQIFLSVYIISTSLSLFTQGRPLDYSFFMHAAFYIRFLGTDQFKVNHEVINIP